MRRKDIVGIVWPWRSSQQKDVFGQPLPPMMEAVFAGQFHFFGGIDDVLRLATSARSPWRCGNAAATCQPVPP